MVERELQGAINIISLRNPMAIYILINLVEKDEAAHVKLNDSEIVQMVQEDEDEEEGEEEEHEKEQVELVETSKEEKLKSSLLPLPS